MNKKRSILDTEWDGDEGQWPDAESYCDDCLINFNDGDAEDWTKGMCKLPVRGPDDSEDDYNRQAVHAIAGALGGARGGITKPDDVDQDDWDKAVKSAANEVIDLYAEMDEIAPDSVYELAGKEAPARQRSIIDVDEWSGNPGQWPDARAYCEDCLIDLNKAAGIENPDDYKKKNCKLPIRGPDQSSDEVVWNAVVGAASAFSGSRSEMKKPKECSDYDWEQAKKNAANEIIGFYTERGQEAPDAVFETAGKTPKRSVGETIKEWLKAGLAMLTQVEEEGKTNMDNTSRSLSLGDIFNKVAEKVYEQDDWAWLVDVFYDDGGTYAIIANEGKLYRAEITVDTELQTVILSTDWTEVVQEFVPAPEGEPVEQTRRGITIRRQKDGTVRGFMVAGTTVLNRVGQIDSRKLHDNLNRHAEQAGIFPYVDFFHLGEAWKMGQVDYLAREGDVAIASFTFDSGSKLSDLMIKAIENDPGYWGCSISFWAEGNPDMVEVANGIKVPVYNDGYYEAITILPEAEAASWFTSVIQDTNQDREINRMNNRVKKALQKLAGDDEGALDELEGMVDETNRAIERDGLITRDASGETEPTEPAAVAEPQAEPVVEDEVERETETAQPVAETELEAVVANEIVLDEDAVAAIAEAVAERMNLNPATAAFIGRLDMIEKSVAALTTEVSNLRSSADMRNRKMDERVKAIEGEIDEAKKAEIDDTPVVRKNIVTYRPRNNGEVKRTFQQGTPSLQRAAAGVEHGAYADIAEDTLANIK